MKKEVANAWMKASNELGIEIEIPYSFKLKNGKNHFYDLFVKDFGSAKGTVVSFGYQDYDAKTAIDEGYFFSAINPDQYIIFSKELFIETLLDWGYFGNDYDTPSWARK